MYVDKIPKHRFSDYSKAQIHAAVLVNQPIRIEDAVYTPK